MKRILILTAEKTGSGHRSSALAIENALKDKGYEVRQLDIFPLMGFMGNLMENSYIPLTTKAPFVYYLCQRFSEFFPWFIHWQMYLRMRKNVLEILADYKPDLIISVHCMFTRSVSHLIRKHGLNIPFYIGVIDLMDPPKVWEDKNADMTFVPTRQIYDEYLKKGFDPQKLMISGFPIRTDIVPEAVPKDELKILMVNPSTSLDKNILFLKEVSRLEDASIDFVCGLDERLYETLEELKKEQQLSDKVRIHGFVNEIGELMNGSHLILTKAGPNIILEAVRSHTAIIITGHIKGQEDHNYRYVTQNGYGIRCENPHKIYQEISDFISSGEMNRSIDRMARDEVCNGAEVIASSIESRI